MEKKDIFKNLGKTLLKEGLPLLANVVTGGAAGRVIELVKGVVGIDTNDPVEIEKKIQENPDLVLKLKEIELNHKIQLESLILESAKIELEETKAYIGDVQNARDREIQLTKATGKRDWLLMALAITVVVGFFVLMFVAMSDGTNLQDNGPVNQLIGALVVGFSMVLSYFFGSSKGSADKNAIMERQNLKATEPQKKADAFENAVG